MQECRFSGARYHTLCGSSDRVPAADRAFVGLPHELGYEHPDSGLLSGRSTGYPRTAGLRQSGSKRSNHDALPDAGRFYLISIDFLCILKLVLVVFATVPIYFKLIFMQFYANFHLFSINKQMLTFILIYHSYLAFR